MENFYLFNGTMLTLGASGKTNSKIIKINLEPRRVIKKTDSKKEILMNIGENLLFGCLSAFLGYINVLSSGRHTVLFSERNALKKICKPWLQKISDRRGKRAYSTR